MEKSFRKCQKNFIEVDRESFRYYMEEAYADLHSAEKEENEKWAIVKAYQALFLMLNALLVRHLGYYSKDHGCVIIALLKNEIVSRETLEKIRAALKEKEKLFSGLKTEEDLFEEISNIRITRNKYLYLPKTLRKLSSSPPGIIEEVKELIKILGEGL